MELIVKNHADLELTAAENIITQLADLAKDNKSTLLLALSGGNSPRNLLTAVSQKIPGELAKRIHIIQVDERIVQPNHSDSNQRMILSSCKEFIAKGALFFPFKVANAKAEEEYNRMMRFYARKTQEFIPALAILGIGLDGHTASIFPGSREHQSPDSTKFAFETEKEYHGYYRVSLTYYALFLFKKALFYVPGAEKASALESVLEKHNIDFFPASKIMHEHSACSIYMTEKIL